MVGFFLFMVSTEGDLQVVTAFVMEFSWIIPIIQKDFTSSIFESVAGSMDLVILEKGIADQMMNVQMV